MLQSLLNTSGTRLFGGCLHAGQTLIHVPAQHSKVTGHQRPSFYRLLHCPASLEQGIQLFSWLPIPKTGGTLNISVLLTQVFHGDMIHTHAHTRQSFQKANSSSGALPKSRALFSSHQHAASSSLLAKLSCCLLQAIVGSPSG